ncbi:hypothetical protein OG589_00090 [Sphaerisporangium sp. NBC_01403]|uniref:hypothetical protein n=1 Tax=Sphaerisporangium sp. NBC_01403 TaxID=2903599 RepID=UPI00324EBA6B
MPTVTTIEVAHRTSPLVAWGLLAGGVFFFAGGPMHPKQDPPNVTVKEHMRIMFEDPSWYPSHTVLLIGMALLALSLVALVRGRSLADVPRMPVVAVIAAIATAVAAPAMLLHLVAAADADRIAAHHSTPITDVQVIVETITVPAFGFSIAALAFVGAATRTLGNLVTAIPGVLGGVGYGLAGATFLVTDKLDFLFPTAAGIAVWAMAAGTGLLLRRRAASTATREA